MSAIGTKQTSACALHMSAFDPKQTFQILTKNSLIYSAAILNGFRVLTGQAFQSDAWLVSGAVLTGARVNLNLR